jgi:choline dehydrogenase
MKYGVVIAGGGTAGAILAARLSEDPARAVLLLEAGPDYAGIDALPPKIRDGYTTAADITPSDHDWGYSGRATPLAGPLGVPRGKLTGGSSAVNGQIFLRGIPEDFDAWAALDNPAWSFQRVLPFFKRLERDLDFRTDYHGAQGPIPVRRFSRAEWLPPCACACAWRGTPPSGTSWASAWRRRTRCWRTTRRSTPGCCGR